MAKRLNARRRKAAKRTTAERLVSIASNLRNGDKDAVHAKFMRKYSLKGMKASRAYDPGVERMTPNGRCRVMHNAQGSEPKAKVQSKSNKAPGVQYGHYSNLGKMRRSQETAKAMVKKLSEPWPNK